MSSVRAATGPGAARRAPTQERSRLRVEAILDAAARVVLERGVETLTTRDIASAARVPVASLYRHFADKESVLLALAERDMSEMDAQVAVDLFALEAPTLAQVVRTAMTAFVSVYHRRRAFVEIYLRQRTDAALHRFGSEHNRRIAETLLAFSLDAGLVRPALTEAKALLAVETGDRIFQLAFEHDDEGDPGLIEEGIVMLTCYLEHYATPAGLG